MFQTLHGPGRGRSGDRLPAPGDGPGHLRQLQERAASQRARSCPSASPRSARASATRSARATSSSACASSSRWRCSTSSHPETEAYEAFETWLPRAPGVVRALRRDARPAPPARARPRRAGPLRHARRSTSSTASPSAGRSWRASTTAATSTCRATRRPRGENLEYFDPATNEHVLPWIVETAGGADRAAFTFLIDAYREEEVRGETRVVLAPPPRPGPVQGGRPAAAQEAARDRRAVPSPQDGSASSDLMAVYDDTAAIGKLLPPPGRDRHAVVRHGRRRFARGRRR